MSETRRRPDDETVEDLIGIAPTEDAAADALRVAAKAKEPPPPAKEPDSSASADGGTET